MNTTRRELLKKTVYVAPAILSLPAIPSFAQTGSGGNGGNGGTLDCDGNEIFCFYDDGQGGVDFGSVSEVDPDALFCSCDS